MPEAEYQVVVFGPGEALHGAAFRAALTARARDMGADVAAALRLLGPDRLDDIRATAPVVAVFLGGDATTHATEAAGIVGASTPVLPVVADLKHFSSLTPPALRPINGIAVDWASPDFSAVVNLVLENLALLRRTRKLFMSYLREESADVAHQLRVAFDDAGYDAFLDTNSVPKGDDFQEVLWHRLLDSDVLVVLDTPNFMSSKWTRLEIAQAQAMSVGMVRVVWPGGEKLEETELAVRLYLAEADFDGPRLTDRALRSVVRETETLRARCVAARHDNLVREFCLEAPKAGAVTVAVQPGRYVLAIMPDERRIAAIPAVGVPDANRYHDASQRFPSTGGPADEAVLVYDHRGLTASWTRYINWLDGFLPVRTLRVTDTAAKLGVRP